MAFPKLPNPLAHRWGRFAAFFFLYLTEGIPLGFTAIAIATQMRRQGVGPAEIGAFVGTLYLPWAWKWLMGPIVDLVYVEKFGRRRGWIIAAQVAMVAMLMTTMGVNFSTELKLFTILIFVVNMFGATQDVAIDALAVGVLEEHERGTANGLMFAGAYLGQAVGGSGVLYLSSVVDFKMSFIAVAAVLLAVTLFVALPMREKPSVRTVRDGPVLSSIRRELTTYIRDVIRAFLGSRSAFLAAIFAALPCGAYALSLALQSNLAVELGLSDNSFGTLTLISTIISAIGCVIGGVLSDRLGRRKMLGAYVICTAVPTLYLAWLMQAQGWIMPIDMDAADRPVAPQVLLTGFWAAVLVFSFFQGLMYGTRTALFMDVCSPAVAATQFTAYMSLLNLVIWYTSTWEGIAIEKLGYPKTLVLDAGAGLLCLLLLPFIRPVKHESATVSGPPYDLPEQVEG